MPLPKELSIEELEARLAFSRAPGVGPALIQQCLAAYGSINRLLKKTPKDLPENLKNSINKADWRGAQNDLRWCDKAEHTLLLYESEAFPPLLKQIGQSPLWLFVRGDINLMQQPQIAVVGSRQASFYGLKATRFLVQDLVSQNIVITSGLALGIDAESHQVALNCDGRTIAVLAVGLDQIYPKCHAKLAEDILAKNGAIVSEFPIGVPPLAIHFPRRNRLISGLSLGVIIVEAKLPSGTLITAQYALEQGREVFVVPGSIFQDTSTGCHALIKQGAQCVTHAEDILEVLALPLKNSVINHANNMNITGLSKVQQKVFEVINDFPQSFDEIQVRLNIDTQSLSMTLTELLLQDIIAETWQGYVKN